MKKSSARETKSFRFLQQLKISKSIFIAQERAPKHKG